MKIRKIALGAFVAGLALYVGAALAGINYVQKGDGTACFRQDITNNDIVCFGAVAGTLTVSEGSTSAGVLNQFVGVPRLATWSIGASVNGTTNTIGHLVYIDATPAGEWVGTTNVTDSTDTTVVFPLSGNTASLKLAIVDAAVAGNGADNTLAGGDQDWSADENYGVWVYSSIALVAGDMVLEITDSSAGATVVNFPAIPAKTWTWAKIDISGVADASKNVVQSIAYDLSTAGASRGAFDIYFASAVKWDTGDAEAIGQDVKVGGLYPLCVLTAAAAVNDPVVITEGVDFIVDYASGNDKFVAITDQSANACGGFAAIN